MESASDSRSSYRDVVEGLEGSGSLLASWRSWESRAAAGRLLGALPLIPRPGRPSLVDTGSPYQNTRPGVKYVGDAARIRCRMPRIGESYRLHPMGRSASPIMPETALDSRECRRRQRAVWKPADFSTPLRTGVAMSSIPRRDVRAPGWNHRSECKAQVQFTLGSGRQALAYLIERDGFLFQSPITRYVRAERWDLSPGYEKKEPPLQKGRSLPVACSCHTNRVENVAGTVNRYEPPIFRGFAIGCERCHGPGELHVRRPTMDDGRDFTIVNPSALEPALRDAVCEQCHLSGLKRIDRLDRRNEDFRPGLPFQNFWIALSAAGTAENKFVNHVEQMHESRCFRASRGSLGCISCHDPHRLPKAGEEVSYFRRQPLPGVPCRSGLQHARRQSGSRLRSRDDNCIGCHLAGNRAASDVFHAGAHTTDHHRIPRRTQPGPIGHRPSTGSSAAAKVAWCFSTAT